MTPRTSASPTVAHQVIDVLRKSEIETLYCLPGVQNDLFFDALVDAPDIRVVMARHEQGAAYMAMGAAQVTGRPAAFCVVPGPGMLNTGAALTSAYWGYARVLAIVGAIPTWLKGKDVGTLHDLHDPTAILSQLTKDAVAIDSPESAFASLQHTINELHHGVPRPVSLEVPVNMWNKPCEGILEGPGVEMAHANSDQVERALGALAAAKRPLIVVGSGAYAASAEVVALAEKLQAPVTTRRQGHGVVPTSHELFVPITVAHGLWATADVVVGIGTRMEWPLNDWGVDDDLTVIQINIDPQEIDRHGLGTIGLLGDAGPTCAALAQALDQQQRDELVSELHERRQQFQTDTAHLVPQRSYTAALRDVIPDDGVIVEDVTQIGFASHLFYDHLAPRTFLTSGAAGNLGAGTGVAIGAADATDKTVVGIVGDGGFLFTANELATAAQHNIDCNIVVFVDGAFGNVRRIQKTRFGADRTIASELRNPDFQKLAEAFGVRSWTADSPESLRPALTEAISHTGPSLIEVAVDEMPDPWPFLRRPANRGPRSVGSADDAR